VLRAASAKLTAASVRAPPHSSAGRKILALAGFSLVPALFAQFIVSWLLSNAEAGWLAGMMSAGYIVAAPTVGSTVRNDLVMTYG
jgi:hypothetical protein